MVKNVTDPNHWSRFRVDQFKTVECLNFIQSLTKERIGIAFWGHDITIFTVWCFNIF